jgi:hypothetical protein
VLTERGEPNAELFVFVYERTPCAGGSMCWACKHVLIFVVCAVAKSRWFSRVFFAAWLVQQYEACMHVGRELLVLSVC